MKDNVSWPQHFNDCFCIWKHIFNHIWVTEALKKPQKTPNMVVNHGKFSQTYSQYPVWARAYMRSRLLSLVILFLDIHKYQKFCKKNNLNQKRIMTSVSSENTIPSQSKVTLFRSGRRLSGPHFHKKINLQKTLWFFIDNSNSNF